MKKIKKLKEFWSNSNVEITVNKREMLLEITVCSLAGILIGILFSPKKTSMFGCHNGSNNSNNNNGTLAPKAKAKEEERIEEKGQIKEKTNRRKKADRRKCR